MILITGATGHYGQAVIDRLLEKNVDKEVFTALVRDPEKAQVLASKGVKTVLGNYDDYGSLLEAFQGIDKLLFISASDVENRVAQHTNIVNAAKKAGVKHVIYTSFVRKDESENSPLAFISASHLLTERLLAESGVKVTVLKNNLYMEGITSFIGDQVLNTKTIYFPSGDGKASFALRLEMAEATANILTSEGHENKVYNLTNTESYTYNDVAEALSQTIGQHIKFVSPDPKEYREVLIEAGLPEVVIQILSGFAIGQAVGELDVESNDLADLLGRKPTSLGAFLKTIY